MGTLTPDLKIKNFFRNIYAGIFPGDKLKLSIQPITRQILLSSLAGFACIGVLYLSSLYNYLLFHSLVELFSVAVSFAMFMLIWNTRRFMSNDFLLFVGVAYLFVGFIDLFHSLAYKGMGVFPGDDANLPTQLWIAARYLQSISLLIAPLFLARRIKPGSLILIFSVVSLILIGSITSGVFPDCYINGLTPFKKISEYIISTILAISALILIVNRRAFKLKILALLLCSILFTILTELSFTFYVSVYGLSNFWGHIFKIIATYFIYHSIVSTGLNHPFDLVFLDLKKRENELYATQEKLRMLATHDSLTGLPNRLLFWDRLEHALEKSQRRISANEHNMVGIIMIDVDNFKNINDKLGHHVGDDVLKEIGRRLATGLRECDTVARLGGDEFTLILEDLQNTQQMAHKIQGLLAPPMLIQGQSLNVTISFGISLFPQHGDLGSDLLRCADTALYHAKETRNSFNIYEKSKDAADD